MTTNEHTPGKWRLGSWIKDYHSGGKCKFLQDDCGVIVGTLCKRQNDVLRRLNSHDALVDALKQTSKYIPKKNLALKIRIKQALTDSDT